MTKIGIGLRRAHYGTLIERLRVRASLGVDWLEYAPENFIDVGGEAREVLDLCMQAGPVVPHGVTASLGGSTPFDAAYLRKLRNFLRATGAKYYSDHVCVSSIRGLETYDLLPVPQTPGFARHIARRIDELSDRLELPIVVENITSYAKRDATLTTDLVEGDFLADVLERSGARLLLDVNNIVVNAKNGGHDAEVLLASMPLDRVAGIHVAGHRWEPQWGLFVDDHASAPQSEVYSLLRSALSRIRAVVGARVDDIDILLEWDQNIPHLDAVISEAERIREIVADLGQVDTAREASPRKVPTLTVGARGSLEDAFADVPTRQIQTARSDAREVARYSSGLSSLVAGASVPLPPHLHAYRTLVARQAAHALEAMFESLRRREDRFDSWVSAFLASGVDRGRRPSDLAAPFAAYIADLAEKMSAPAWARELAEYIATRIEVRDAESSVAPASCVVAYNHAVVEAYGSTDASVPRAEPGTWFVWRARDHRVRTRLASSNEVQTYALARGLISTSQVAVASLSERSGLLEALRTEGILGSTECVEALHPSG